VILIVDDDYSVTASLGLLLKQAGHASQAVDSPAAALAVLGSERIDLVLQDMNFSRQTTGEEGLQLLRQIKELHPNLPVVLITAWGSIALAVEGVKIGASDFLTKPWGNDQLLASIETILELSRSIPESSLERDELDRRYDLSNVIGKDPKLLSALELIGRVAATDASILITGESGTGKEVIAEAIHRNSSRSEGPFVKVNLGGIPSTLFESEMFGHTRGAFTDAHQERKGRFETANGGTILLDEIGDLDFKDQVKMLRVLQDRTIEVLGSSQSKSLSIRVISATNKDLDAAVATGEFREDLLYRLNLIRVHLPALRERPGDISLLSAHFLARAQERYGRSGVEIDAAGEQWLSAQSWPGNIRQLEHAIERALLVHDGQTLGVDAFRRALDPGITESRRRLPDVGEMTMDEVEKALIEKNLAHHDGNLSKVAESLGISRQALYRRLSKHGIET